MIEQKEAFVILTPGFAASDDDSTCLPMQQQLVKKIASLNPRLVVFVLSFQYPYHSNEYQWNGITIIPFDGRNRGGVHKLLLRKKVETVLERLKEQYKIKGLLSFWLNECALVGKRFGKKNGIPHFCWLLGQDAREGNKYVKRIGVSADELIALSDSVQQEFFKNYGIRPLQVIPPGIEPLPPTNAIRDIDILGVGSLIPLKRYTVFIELVAAIKSVMPSIKAVLVGAGPERKKLEALIKRYDLGQNVELAGSVSHDEVLAMMQRSKLLLHPSEYEGFSGVCMEALSRGAYVLSFCQPMNYDIDHWHVADSQLDMKSWMLCFLSKEHDHQPVSISELKQTALQMMQLFQLKEAQGTK